MTKEEITKIANEVAIIMKSSNNAKTDHDDTPEGATMDADGNVIYHDPAVKAADEAEMDMLKSLPKGVIVVKGRNGATMINQSQESLEAIANWKKNRKQYRTRARV